MVDNNIYKLSRYCSTIQGITTFYVYRGSASNPQMLAVCPSQEAADAAFRLFSLEDKNNIEAPNLSVLW
jgi:hypothetical protein